MKKLVAIHLILFLLIGVGFYKMHKAIEGQSVMIMTLSEYLIKLQEAKKLPTWDELNK